MASTTFTLLLFILPRLPVNARAGGTDLSFLASVPPDFHDEENPLSLSIYHDCFFDTEGEMAVCRRWGFSFKLLRNFILLRLRPAPELHSFRPSLYQEFVLY